MSDKPAPETDAETTFDDGIGRVVSSAFAEKLERERDELRAEVERLKADKARLDWLGESNHADLIHCDCTAGFYVERFHMETVPTLREAIDAAMKGDA